MIIYFRKIFQVFTYWVNRTDLIDKLLKFNNLKAADIVEWYTADLVDHGIYC